MPILRPSLALTRWGGLTRVLFIGGEREGTPNVTINDCAYYTLGGGMALTNSRPVKSLSPLDNHQFGGTNCCTLCNGDVIIANHNDPAETDTEGAICSRFIAASQTWTNIASHPAKVWNAPTNETGNALIQFWKDSSALGKVLMLAPDVINKGAYVYDPVTDVWTNIPFPYPGPWTRVHFVKVNPNFFYATVSPISAPSTILGAAFQNGAWEPWSTPGIPEVHGMCATGHDILITYRWGVGGVNMSTYRYRLNIGTWTQVGDVLTPRYDACLLGIGSGYAYLAGGEFTDTFNFGGPHTDTDTIEKFDPVSGLWSLHTETLSQPLHRAMGISIPNDIWGSALFAGGVANPSGAFVDQIKLLHG